MSRLFTAFGTLSFGVGFIVAPVASLLSLMADLALSRSGVSELTVGGWRLSASHVSLLIGLLVAGLLIVMFAIVLRSKHFQLAADVYPDEGQGLNDWYRSLNTQITLLKKAREGNPGERPPVADQLSASAALATAEQLLECVRTQLDHRGPEWLAASGYLLAWTRLDRIEEELVLFGLEDTVISFAREDQLRLQSSDIKQSQALLAELNDALKVLRPSSVITPAGDRTMDARRTVQSVRRSVNRYREEKWNDLVRQRNWLMLGGSMLCLLVYVGLVLLLMRDVAVGVIATGCSFALVAAVVSLAHQLTVSSPTTGVEDYGQAGARLLTAVFASAVVGLVAVIVLATLDVSVNGSAISGRFTSWEDTFSPTRNAAGYLIAALFGFAPSLLFAVLQQRADSLKESLDSTRSTGAQKGRAPG